VKGARIRLQRPGGDEIAVGKGPEATIVGDPLELVLYLQGRRDHAHVEVTGHPSAVEALSTADLGI
jgi:hypothetical protein